MHYVYLLFSDKKNKFYIGSTSDLRRRFSEHNHGLCASTKYGHPWKLIYYEAYLSKTDAIKREQSLKSFGQGLRRLKERLFYSCRI